MVETQAAARGRRAARPSVRTVRAVINQASGSVGRGAQAQVSRALAEHGLSAAEISGRRARGRRAGPCARRWTPRPTSSSCWPATGTARLAGQMCGPDGPLLAPLAGGTNEHAAPMRCTAPGPWGAALNDLLADGVERAISGGEVEGRALLRRRHTGRAGMVGFRRARPCATAALRLALLRADRALRRAFAGRLRFALDGGERERAEALTLMCPLVSRGEGPVDALEASVLTLKGAGGGLPPWHAHDPARRRLARRPVRAHRRHP